VRGAAVRHVFVDNVANYRKDALQMRVLRPGLGTGLLTAEGDDWRVQRRALAPLFTPRMVAEFLQPMMQSADWLVQRWAPLREGRRIDLASEMSRVTLDVLERTIFPQGLTRDPAAFAKAMGAYLLSDRATWISFKGKDGLAIVVEGDTKLFNQYGVMLVNPAKHPHVKLALGQAFVDYVISAEGQKVIADYKIEGQQLFFPNAGK
jgi:cytochrome P450